MTTAMTPFNTVLDQAFRSAVPSLELFIERGLRFVPYVSDSGKAKLRAWFWKSLSRYGLWKLVALHYLARSRARGLCARFPLRAATILAVAFVAASLIGLWLIYGPWDFTVVFGPEDVPAGDEHRFYTLIKTFIVVGVLGAVAMALARRLLLPEAWERPVAAFASRFPVTFAILCGVAVALAFAFPAFAVFWLLGAALTGWGPLLVAGFLACVALGVWAAPDADLNAIEQEPILFAMGMGFCGLFFTPFIAWVFALIIEARGEKDSLLARLVIVFGMAILVAAGVARGLLKKPKAPSGFTPFPSDFHSASFAAPDDLKSTNAYDEF